MPPRSCAAASTQSRTSSARDRSQARALTRCPRALSDAAADSSDAACRAQIATSAPAVANDCAMADRCRGCRLQ